MAKRDSLQGSLDLLVLKALSRRPGLHGYALMAAIQAASADVLRVEEGSLYPALHRMEESGWLRAGWTTRTVVAGFVPTASRQRAANNWAARKLVGNNSLMPSIEC